MAMPLESASNPESRPTFPREREMPMLTGR
jgi:hypothetical protein